MVINCKKLVFDFSSDDHCCVSEQSELEVINISVDLHHCKQIENKVKKADQRTKNWADGRCLHHKKYIVLKMYNQTSFRFWDNCLNLQAQKQYYLFATIAGLTPETGDGCTR